METGKWGSFDGWFHWGRDFYMGILYPFRGQVLFNSIQAIYILRDSDFPCHVMRIRWTGTKFLCWLILISWPKSFWWFLDTTLIKPAVGRGLCMLVAYGWNLSTYVYQYMGTSLLFINLLWNGDSKVVFVLALSGLYQSLSRFTSWPWQWGAFPSRQP